MRHRNPSYAVNYRNNQGLGGRFVPPEVGMSQREAEWGSKNRRTYEEVKVRFASWAVYDNSVEGREPEMAASSERTEDEERE